MRMTLDGEGESPALLFGLQPRHLLPQLSLGTCHPLCQKSFLFCFASSQLLFHLFRPFKEVQAWPLARNLPRLTLRLDYCCRLNVCLPNSYVKT